ncbi:hypothetical protein [Flammeovirga pacifica]|uniref:Uncharacterized protein n=1 Tax=Flammeovirga pacifica TaxID=915059 RepID=A0A1S1Z5G6_FLAPC|nr:hypothetical protein [Flammeovirga pacifica]OHX68325.1 hypothetical protein NH26_19220 [Flammeovirga pacifica]
MKPFFNKALLFVVFLGLFFNCTVKDEVPENPIAKEIDLPNLSLVDSVDFLRRTAKLSVVFEDYDKEIINLQEVGLYYKGSLLVEGNASADLVYDFEFDSKLLSEGIQDLEVIAQFEEVEGLSETKNTLDFSVEIDNYFPTISIKEGYVENIISSAFNNSYLQDHKANFAFFIADNEGKRITEIFDVSQHEGDSINVEIPEGYEGQEFYLGKISVFSYTYTPNDFYYNNKDKNFYLEKKHSNESSIAYGEGSGNSNGDKEITITYPKAFENYNFSFSGDIIEQTEEGDNITLKLEVINHKEGIEYKNVFGNYFILKKSNGEYIFIVTSLLESGSVLNLTESDFRNDYLTQTFEQSDYEHAEGPVSFIIYPIYENKNQYCVTTNAISKSYDNGITINKIMKPLNEVNVEYHIVSYLFGATVDRRVTSSFSTLPGNNFVNFTSDEKITRSINGNEIKLETTLEEGNLKFQFRKTTTSTEEGYKVYNVFVYHSNSEIDINLSNFELKLEEYSDPDINEIFLSNNSNISLIVQKDEFFITDKYFYNSYKINSSNSRTNYVELPKNQHEFLIFDETNF